MKKKLVKSCHKNKKDLLLCLDDLISCDGEDPGPSTEWICAVDRGGLMHINNLTFELFLTMEYCIRNHVLAGSEYRDVQAQLKQNDDILFCGMQLLQIGTPGQINSSLPCGRSSKLF